MGRHHDPGKDAPEDGRNGAFLGRARTAEGPTPVCGRGGAVFDRSRIAPTISLLIERCGWTANRSRKTAIFVCPLFALPIAAAKHAPGLTSAVLLIDLAWACRQGFSAEVYAIPGDLFPRRTTGSVIRLGGLRARGAAC